MMFARREPSKATREYKKKTRILRKKVKKSKKWTLARLKGSPASRGQKKDLHLSQNWKKSSHSREKKKKNTRNKDFGKRNDDAFLLTLFYHTFSFKMSSSMSASSAALGSKLALHKVRFFASSQWTFFLLLSRCSRKFLAIPSLHLSLFWGEIFSSFYLSKGAPGCENG
jgi:hypothetical protein